MKIATWFKGIFKRWQKEENPLLKGEKHHPITVADSMPPPPAPPSDETPEQRSDRERHERIQKEEAKRR